MDIKNIMESYIGKTLDNRYLIQEIIGFGGMAVVYKAHCNLLNRDVAIKILRNDMAADQEFRKHFRDEALAVAQLSHPNLVSVYDVSKDSELDYIVMELVEGVTLKQYMLSKGKLSVNESVHFATQVCRALEHAHGKGIVHRDIKPQNIMITMDGNVKVADFGIAYLENSNEERNQTAVGSVHYVSPEQAKGMPTDCRTDIYSLGVVLFEMLSGQLPYNGDTPEEIARQHVGANPPSLQGIDASIPEELESITNKAMNADITQRYQTASEMLKDLESFSKSQDSADETEDDDLPPDVRPISRSGELNKEAYKRRKRRASKVSTLSGIAIVIAFVLVVSVFIWNYWVKDLFSTSERINIPNFVGTSYQTIKAGEYSDEIYNFVVTYAPSSEYGEGIIISQTPDAGKSLALDEDGIDVSLVVSSGIEEIAVEDVTGQDYRAAATALEAQGFIVNTTSESSDIYEEDIVMSMSPAAGTLLPTGSTINLIYSSGALTVSIEVPNLIGLTKDAAEEKIESSGLTVGSISYKADDMPAGTVIWQSISAYSDVDQNTRIYLQVSTGPEEKPDSADNTGN